MKTFYIRFERQGWTLAIVKVEANDYKEAEYKAFKALHQADDVFECSQEEAAEAIKSNDIDYIIDENGEELDSSELEPEDYFDEESIF